jgi:hypothetical protein
VHVQPQLPVVRAKPRRRNIRRPFRPAPDAGPYKLPRDIHDRLTAALAPYKNREAAYALATFLGRFWSMPARIVEAFPIDRRELADRPDLGLTEDRVRGAIRVLEEVDFLDRALTSGSRYRATEDGLHRKAILFMFGADYAPAFLAANRRAVAARGGVPGERRPIPAESARRPATPSPVAPVTKSPKSTGEPERSMIMGEVVKEGGIPPDAFAENPGLGTALDRLLQGIRQSRGG